MAWFTTKHGKHINTDWLDEEERQKYAQIDANAQLAARLNGTKKTYVSPLRTMQPDGSNVDPAKRLADNFAKKGISSEADIINHLRSLSPTRRNRLAVEMGIGGRGEEKTKAMAKAIFLAGKREGQITQPQPTISDPIDPNAKTITNEQGFEISRNPIVSFSDAHWQKMKELKEMDHMYYNDPFKDHVLRDEVEDKLRDLRSDQLKPSLLSNYTPEIAALDKATQQYFYGEEDQITDDEYWAAIHQLADKLNIMTPRYSPGVGHGENFFFEYKFGTIEEAEEWGREHNQTHIYDRITGKYFDIRSAEYEKGKYEDILGPKRKIEDPIDRLEICHKDKIINPNYQRWGQTGQEYNKWHKNCALCSAASVLQARGYDVEAGPRDPDRWRGCETIFEYDLDNPDNYLLGGAKDKFDNFGITRKILTKAENEAVNKYPYMGYSVPVEQRAENYKRRNEYEKELKEKYQRMPQGANAAAKAITKKMQEWGPGAIGELSVHWKNTKSNHSILVLNNNGTVYLWDSQNNETHISIADYLKATTANRTQLVRMDNAQLKDGVEEELKKMFRKRGGK